MTTAYAYETSSNRLTGETGARVRDYLYDPLGNITADGVHEYIYDLRNRLVSIDNGDVGHYLIGPLGERLWKKGIIPGQAVFDPNGDGVIDKEDLIAVRAARKAFRKFGTFTPEADCTGDGTVIDKADSVCMRQRLRYQRKTTRWSEKTAILSAMLVGKSPDCTGDGVVDEADKICVKEKVRNARPRRNHIPVIDLAGDCTGDGLLNRDDRICVRRYINISARLVKIAAKVTEQESWAASLPYPVTGGGGASQDEEEILFFAYDADGALIGEYDASGAPVRETIRLAGLPVGVISNGVTYRIHPDHLGSPRAITDDVDKVIWRWTGLNPFGLDAADEDPDGDGTKFTFNQRFPGQYFDGESGFHYNYYRDFSPSTGRYVQSDPIGLAGGLNTYGYVDGNPVGYSDSKGLFVDVLADVGFLLYDIYRIAADNVFRSCGNLNENLTALGADAAGFFIPGATGLGLGVRITKGADNIPWGSWNDYQKVISSGKEYAKVGDRLYTRHAVDRMQPSGLGTPAGGAGAGRSFPPNLIEEVIKTGSSRTVNRNGVTRTVHSSGTAEVVTEQGGNIVVTVNPFKGR